mmetsp:Transcript_17562/g.60020  ORF Transcript_17562/g.60020 Transcript_17562/m.60020 type:complete len:183 (-) Transcript_17562:173-721(-)
MGKGKSEAGAPEITLNVKLTHDLRNETNFKVFNRFQREFCGPHLNGKTVSVRCRPTDTVAELKAKLAKASGELAPESIKRGGCKGGEELPDNKTLEELGYSRTMSVWEHLFTDSAANRESYAVERECLERDIDVDFETEFSKTSKAHTNPPEYLSMEHHGVDKEVIDEINRTQPDDSIYVPN